MGTVPSDVVRAVFHAYNALHPSTQHSNRWFWRMNKATAEAIAKEFGNSLSIPKAFTEAQMLGIPVEIADTDQILLAMRVE